MKKSLQPRIPKRGRDRHYNPDTGSWERAQELNRRFHGRDTKEIIELIEDYQYEKNVAVIGELIELMVVTDSNRGIGVPIRFGKEEDDNKSDKTRPFLTGAVNGKVAQLYINGGDQNLNLDRLEVDVSKQFIFLGQCFSVTYWTDKHHLEGPKYQQKGTSYEHEFGEEGGTLPTVVYDSLNKNVILVGGSYKIEDEGLTN